MRNKMLSIIAAGALLFGVAGQSQAGVIEYDGTLFVSVGTLPPLIGIDTGVATINGSAGFGHVNTISFDGGLSTSATIPLSDPDNATLITLIGEVALPTTGENNGLDMMGGGSDNQMALGGQFTICLLFANCIGPLPIPITINGTKGAGLGGTFTVNTYADSGFKLSVQAAPWTIGLASVKSASTDMSPPGCQVGSVGCATNATYTYDDTRSGFAHAPGSATSSTAGANGGVLQVVTPVKIETNLNPPSEILAVWGILTLNIPEPGLSILLASGVAGLVLIGRQRMRK